MANYFQSKTKEEIEKIIKKSQETRKANKAKQRQEEEVFKNESLELKFKIKSLRHELSHLQSFNAKIDQKSLDHRFLLDEEAIVINAIQYTPLCGIYFLILNNKIVYVGQSVNIHQRISQHRPGKEFTHFTYIEFKQEMLDKLESLYIHTLKPKLNGEYSRGKKSAPMRIDQLIL